MGFWIYMLAFSLLIPIIMLVIGAVFRKRSPKNINYVLGFRTPMSMKNKDTWEFAHKHIGKTWFVSGIVSLPISVVIMLLVFGKSGDVVGMVSGILIVVQTIYICITIIPTIVALRRNFDKWGFKRNK